MARLINSVTTLSTTSTKPLATSSRLTWPCHVIRSSPALVWQAEKGGLDLA
jgi:hypothetical protein